jgi:hypothetical protein
MAPADPSDNVVSGDSPPPATAPVLANPEPDAAPALPGEPDPDVRPGADSRPGTARDAGGPPTGDTARLLVKAIGMLPESERDQVYTWLLSSTMSGGGLASPYAGTGPLPRRLRDLSAQLLPLISAGAGPGTAHGARAAAQQVVPVRFAAEQHAQLRSWCAEHGFSMATVIRGLVARFLEGQLPAQD